MTGDELLGANVTKERPLLSVVLAGDRIAFKPPTLTGGYK